MKRRLIAALLAMTLAAGGSMSVCAAEETEGTVENEAEEAAGEEINVLESYEEPEAGAEEETVIAENLEAEAVEAANTEEPVELAEDTEEVATAETLSGTDEYGTKWELTDGVLTVLINENSKDFSHLFTEDERREVTSVVIEEGTTIIPDDTFWGFSSLTSVSIPGSVTEIGQEAFNGCSALTSVSIPGSVTKIGVYAFGGCTSLKDISIPESVTEIGSGAFAGCKNLTRIAVPKGVTEINSEIFAGCENLTQMTIPNSVTGIAYWAFANCQNLKKVTIPESVKSIGIAAFLDCTGLQTVTFKGDAPEIGRETGSPISWELWKPGYTSNPFSGVTAVAYYPAGNETYTDEIKAAYGEGLTWKENTAAEMSFTDVKEIDWYYEAAGYVFARGIMTGMNGTEFGPSVQLSRSQFATILYRMEGEPKEEYDEAAFPDVADNMFYTFPAMWAKKTGVIKGYDDGRFGPADENTREQMAVMMYRYAEMLGLDVSASDDLSGFPDADKVSGFAEKEMKWAVGKGLIQGDGGRINPQGTAERAQCATIIMRFMEAYGL